MSLRYSSKSKMSKFLPLRWSFGSKDRRKPSNVPPQTETDELVEYLESGRRPRCTKEPIVSIVASPSQVKAQLREDDTLGSPSGSSGLNGVERSSYQGPGSPRLPEGQRRPAPDFNSNDAKRASGSSAKKSSKTSKKEQESSQVGKTLQGSPTGLPNGTGSAANGSRDSTSKRHRSQAASTNRTHASQAQVAAGKSEESRCKDGGPSANSSGSTAAQLQHGRSKDAHVKTPSNKNSTKISLSNGTLNGKGIEVKKTSNGHKSTSKSRESHGSWSTADIKRAHSSSNIQSRHDTTLKRTLSLQRNGPLVPIHREPAGDKPSYATLNRLRYSSTSLGRQRPVPESCF